MCNLKKIPPWISKICSGIRNEIQTGGGRTSEVTLIPRPSFVGRGITIADTDRLKLHSHNIIEFHRALHWDNFLPYTPHPTPHSAIISSLDINHHLCVDDIQIYMSLSSKLSLRVVATLVNGCIGLVGRVQAVV